MSSIEKLIERLKLFPKDFSYEELLRVLSEFDFKEFKTGKTSGSRVKFIRSDGVEFRLHKPHKGRPVKDYKLREFVKLINQIEQEDSSNESK